MRCLRVSRETPCEITLRDLRGWLSCASSGDGREDEVAFGLVMAWLREDGSTRISAAEEAFWEAFGLERRLRSFGAVFIILQVSSAIVRRIGLTRALPTPLISIF